MSFQIGYDPAELWAARTIDKVRRALLDAYMVARKTKGTKKKDLAKKLGKDPAQITRWLTRPEQLSIKSLGHLAYALECDVKVELVALYSQQVESSGSNRPEWCSAVLPAPMAQAAADPQGILRTSADPLGILRKGMEVVYRRQGGGNAETRAA
jgi:transcriptional regulator with XRE-family HTH domain